MVVNEDAQGKKYYNHEFTTIKKIDALPAALQNLKTSENGQRHQSFLFILAEDIWNVNVTKAVDENGEPLVVERNGQLVFVNNDGQVKSATSNRGTFNANSTDIYSQSEIDRIEMRGNKISKKKLLFQRSEPLNTSPVTGETLRTIPNKTGDTIPTAMSKSNNSLPLVGNNINSDGQTKSATENNGDDEYQQGNTLSQLPVNDDEFIGSIDVDRNHSGISKSASMTLKTA